MQTRVYYNPNTRTHTCFNVNEVLESAMTVICVLHDSLLALPPSRQSLGSGDGGNDRQLKFHKFTVPLTDVNCRSVHAAPSRK